MGTIEPLKIGPDIQIKKNLDDHHQKLTSVEQGKLWGTYIGNTMSICVLSYMLSHVEDQDIKVLLENAHNLSKQLVQNIKEIYEQENYPLPRGFTDEDVNIGAPRLFADELYLHYLKYASKAGISLYSIAIPLVTRSDVRQLFTQCIDLTIKLLNLTNETLIRKGMTSRPAFIPYPDKVDFVKKQNYLNGFFGKVRPLQALEITHLYDNIENSAISKAILLGFSQTAKLDQTRDYFLRGKEMVAKHYDIFSELLQKEDLSAPPLLDPLVTNSTFAPFSDRLMMFHKFDMFAVRIRSFGNALSMSARHDIAEKFGRLILEVGNYVEDGANILIDHGWLEQPPQAVDRETLTSQ